MDSSVDVDVSAGQRRGRDAIGTSSGRPSAVRHPTVVRPVTDNHHQRNDVNGHDVRRGGAKDAVHAFHSSTEPLVIEVLRRAPPRPDGIMASIVAGVPPPSASPPTIISSETAGAVAASHRGKTVPMSPPGSASVTSTTSTQTEERDDEDEVDYVVEHDDVQHFQTIDMPSSAVSGFYDYQNFTLENTTGIFPRCITFNEDGGIGDLSLTDLEAVATRMQECDDDFVAASAFDFEYETVTLHRSGSNQKVGLTLCYGATYDGLTDVFISEVEPHSIAAEDARIREGDQIIQINGVDVHSRDQAVQMFAGSASDIQLVLARPVVSQMEDDFMEVYTTLDDVNSQIYGIETSQRYRMPYDEPCRFNTKHSDDGCSTDATYLAAADSLARVDKDSGLGRTDDSMNIRDSSIERELAVADDAFSSGSSPSPFFPSFSSIAIASSVPACHASSTLYTASRQTSAKSSSPATSSPSSPRHAISHPLAIFRPPPPPPAQPLSSSVVAPPRGAADESNTNDGEISVAAEIAALSREMERIHLQYREIVNAHRLVDDDGDVVVPISVTSGQTVVGGSSSPDLSFRSPRSVPRMGTRVEPVSSATGDGCCGSPRASRQPRVADGSSPRRTRTAASAERSRYPSGSSPLKSTVHCSEAKSSTHSDLERRQTGSGCGDGATVSPCSTSSSTKTSAQHHYPRRSGQRAWNSDDGMAPTIECEVRAGSGTSAALAPASAANLQTVYSQYADVMYTNAANLQHTIALQQNLFQQQLAERQRHESSSHHLTPSCTSAPVKSETATGHPLMQRAISMQTEHYHTAAANGNTCQDRGATGTGNGDAGVVSMEWVVKRRSDGTRYVTRRPRTTGTGPTCAAPTASGNQYQQQQQQQQQQQNKQHQQHRRRRLAVMLREERARQLEIARRAAAVAAAVDNGGGGYGCGGTTTDDDAASEMKLGRYWTRDERRQHIQRRRERDQQLLLLRQRRLQEALALQATGTNGHQGSTVVSSVAEADNGGNTVGEAVAPQRSACPATCFMPIGSSAAAAQRRSGIRTTSKQRLLSGPGQGAGSGGTSAAPIDDFHVVQEMVLAAVTGNTGHRHGRDVAKQLLSVTTV